MRDFHGCRKRKLILLEAETKTQTAKSTKTWLNVFNEWKLQRNNEARRFEDIPPEELDAILCRFFAEIRKKDGGEYEPESLAVMQSALDRHLENAGKKHSILRDREFEKSRQQLEAKARELRVKGYGKRKNASHALNEEDEEFLWQSDAVSGMWKHVFSHVRGIVYDAQCIQTAPSPLADTLAAFTLSALESYPGEVKDLAGVSFTSLFQELGVQDEVSPSFCCRFLCHILPCSGALTAIHADHLEGSVIHTWFRCLLQLPSSHEGLAEFTRAVSKLPEMETILRNQPGFGTGESSETSQQLFIIALGRYQSSLTKFDESIQFREKVQRYLGDVMKYVDHVLKNAGPPDLLRLAYHVAGLLTKHCYKIIYSKTQPRCLFPRLVDQFALPLPNSKKPVAPLVMQCIKTHLHQFLHGLSCLDFKRDEFIRRKIKQVFTTYFRLFNQMLQTASQQSSNIPTKNPFMVVLKGSCLSSPTPESSEFRQFTIEIIRESFLHLPQPPANLTATLYFLEQLFRKTLSTSETARNTPVLLTAITGCLLACNQFTPGNEPPEIRRQASEILRLMLVACRTTQEIHSRDILLPHLRDFLYSNIARAQGSVFKTFEALATFDPDLMAGLIQAGKQAVIQLEQKRGVGTDMQLRSSFKSFLSKLGHSGEVAIKALEEEDTAMQH